MYTMNQSVWEKWERVGKIRVLARAILNGLAGRVVARGPPGAHPCLRGSIDQRCLVKGI